MGGILSGGFCYGRDFVGGIFVPGDFFRGDFCDWIFSGWILSGYRYKCVCMYTHLFHGTIECIKFTASWRWWFFFKKCIASVDIFLIKPKLVRREYITTNKKVSTSVTRKCISTILLTKAGMDIIWYILWWYIYIFWWFTYSDIMDIFWYQLWEFSDQNQPLAYSSPYP